MDEQHWICLPVKASLNEAQRIASDVAFIAAGRGWSRLEPLLVREADAVLSVTGWDQIDGVVAGGGHG